LKDVIYGRFAAYVTRRKLKRLGIPF